MQTTFNAPPGSNPIALDLGSMGKGEVWINGESIGRYWVSFVTRKGNPSQRWYVMSLCYTFICVEVYHVDSCLTFTFYTTQMLKKLVQVPYPSITLEIIWKLASSVCRRIREPP